MPACMKRFILGSYFQRRQGANKAFDAGSSVIVSCLPDSSPPAGSEAAKWPTPSFMGHWHQPLPGQWMPGGGGGAMATGMLCRLADLLSG